jgi:hypothetical protein
MIGRCKRAEPQKGSAAEPLVAVCASVNSLLSLAARSPGNGVGRHGRSRLSASTSPSSSSKARSRLPQKYYCHASRHRRAFGRLGHTSSATAISAAPLAPAVVHHSSPCSTSQDFPLALSARPSLGTSTLACLTPTPVFRRSAQHSLISIGLLFVLHTQPYSPSSSISTTAVPPRINRHTIDYAPIGPDHSHQRAATTLLLIHPTQHRTSDTPTAHI